MQLSRTFSQLCDLVLCDVFHVSPSLQNGALHVYQNVHLQSVLHIRHLPSAGALKTKEAALQALGCLGIARPKVLLLKEAQAVTAEALRRSSPALLKMRGLHNLNELLKVPISCSAAIYH